MVDGKFLIEAESNREILCISNGLAKESLSTPYSNMPKVDSQQLVIYLHRYLCLKDFTTVNNAQRELLAKALADISKGIFIGVLLPGATDKLSF